MFDRAYELVVVGLLQWIKKLGADRFTTPYARVPPHPPRPLLPRQSPVEKGSQAEGRSPCVTLQMFTQRPRNMGLLGPCCGEEALGFRL